MGVPGDLNWRASEFELVARTAVSEYESIAYRVSPEPAWLANELLTHWQPWVGMLRVPVVDSSAVWIRPFLVGGGM